MIINPLWAVLFLLVYLVFLFFLQYSREKAKMREIDDIQREKALREQRIDEQVEWLKRNSIIPNTYQLVDDIGELYNMGVPLYSYGSKPNDPEVPGNWRLTDDGEIEEITDGNK